jgi:hypothetical protein
MKHIASLLLLFLASFPVYGQVVIVPVPHQEGYLSLDDIWRVNLVSSKPQAVNAQLEVTVEDAQHQLVLSAISPSFNLRQGSNRPVFNVASAKTQYGARPATKVLRSTGRFPYGNYIVCYRVVDFGNGTMLGEFCQEETVKPFSPPELVSPYNTEEITTTLPILAWKPPFPPGTVPFEYVLRLAEVKEKQDAVEALETNAPLVNRRGIFSTSLPYPSDAPKLETGKTYAWQVSAKSGDFELGVTEVWVFQVAGISFMPPPVGAYKSYRELKLTPDGSFNPIKQKLRFVYNNRWAAPNLDYESTSPPTALERVYYKIYPVGKQASPVSMSSSLTLVTGINKLAINLQGVTGINNGENYIMVLRDPVGKEYYLEFTYHN